MINRILIRIKVVQILYAYLLSKSEFTIDTRVQGASRDRRFAYAVYLDMLQLIQELSGFRSNNADRRPTAIDIDKRLKANRVGGALAANPVLKSIIYSDAAHLNELLPLLQSIHDKIVKSKVFTDFAKKRNHTLEDDVKFWTVTLQTTILKDPEIVQVLRSNDDFSISGFNNGIMQAVNTLQAYNDERYSYTQARTQLTASLDKSYELYLALFVLMIELTDEQIDRFDTAKSKYLPKAEEINPETRFIDNKFIAELRQSPVIQQFIEDNKFTWLDAPALRKNLLDAILASPVYAEYMNSPHDSLHDECEFWRDIMRSVVLPSDALAEALESKSIYWNDDVAIVGTFVLKTIRRFSQAEAGSPIEFLPQFKDDEDSRFGLDLFTATVQNQETYRKYIDQFISPDWDPERLAFMDIVIMLAAIAEILNFPTIPLPVSLNEYIEIANAYSTKRSGSFINGILYSVINKFIEQGDLHKPLSGASDKQS